MTYYEALELAENRNTTSEESELLVMAEWAGVSEFDTFSQIETCCECGETVEMLGSVYGYNNDSYLLCPLCGATQL